jgi:Carboxypeptidase regulatory-like domain
MKPASLLFITLLVAVGVSAQTPRPADSPLVKQEECNISGMVVELGGSKPLKGARIELQGTDDHARSTSSVADASGHFAVKKVQPGRYRLTVSKAGYVTQEYGQRKPGDPGAALTLRAGQDLKDLLFRLIPSAVISGRVLDEEGQPLQLAVVTATREVYNEGKRVFSAEATFQTNDLGEFRLFGLPPGKYLVSAVDRSEKFERGGFLWQEPTQDSGEPELGYAKIYYPGTVDPARASPLVVKAGEEISSIQFLLRQVRVYRVRGHVYNLISPQRRNGTQLTLFPNEIAPDWDAAQQAFSDPGDGSFEIRNVLPGSYILIAHSFDEGKTVRSARTVVDVGEADVGGVSLTIASGMTINGQILWDGPACSQEGDFLVMPMPVDRTAVYTSGSTRVDAKNTFTLKDMNDGTYRVNVWGVSKDCFVKDVQYGGASAYELGFTVIHGATSTLEITLSSRGARLQGNILDGDNLPTAGVWVVLVPDPKHRTRFDLYKRQTTDQYGHFEFRGIPPGEYKLFSWDQAEEDAWEDPEFLKPFEEKGQQLEVKEGDQKTVNLVTIRPGPAGDKAVSP